MPDNAPDRRRSHPSSQRNREPIGRVLQTHLPANSRVLEIAAGTGEQAVYLSRLLAADYWLPTDANPTTIESIDAWRETDGPASLQRALLLDASDPVETARERLLDAGALPPAFDALLCINMIHISPWTTTQGLMRLAGALLRDEGLLYLYGPYKRDGRHTAPSNAEFDADLQSRNPEWGIRNLDDVCAQAKQHTLALHDVVDMPANNLSVIFRKMRA